jgi:hypothetical protein
LFGRELCRTSRALPGGRVVRSLLDLVEGEAAGLLSVFDLLLTPPLQGSIPAAPPGVR